MAAIKAAYEEQMSFVGPTANIFLALDGYDPTATPTPLPHGANGCALCQYFGRPPCLRATAPLLAGDGAAPLANSEAVTQILGGALTEYVKISGELVTEGCSFPGVVDGTTEIATVGGPSEGLNPGSLTLPGPLTLTVCSMTMRSEGFTNCASGGIANTRVDACQDSELSDGDECPTALGPLGSPTGTTLCLPQPDANTGGLCLKFSTSTGSAGNSIALTTSQLRILLSTQFGPDGVPCTADDTGAPTPPNTIAITTGTVSAVTLDAGSTPGTANNNNISEGPIAGTAGPGCAQLAAGNLSGLTLVGAFPAPSTGATGDGVTALELQVQ
jgi:hypothetical protein